MMTEKKRWDEVTSRYMSREQLDDFAAASAGLPEGFDQESYQAKWKDLGDRIQAALPMDPAGDQAQAFLDEWQALIQPFLAVATPGMLAGVQSLYDNMGDWQGEADLGFTPEVWRFHQEAAKARTDRAR